MISRQLPVWSALMMVMALCLEHGVVQAQTQRSGSDAARVMQQVQQVTAEKAKLQADLDAARKELDELKSRYQQATTALSAAQQKSRELERSTTMRLQTDRSDEQALEKSRAQLSELLSKYRELTDTLKQVETDRAALTTQVATQKRELSTCVDRNAGMYLLSDEVLKRMADQGFWSALKNKESFTQISRTRLENLIEDYRYRIDEMKIRTSSTP